MNYQTDKSRRSAEAERLLSEPLLIEALDSAEKKALNDLLGIRFWETRKQRMLIDRINTIRGMRQYLKAVVVTNNETARRVVA